MKKEFIVLASIVGVLLCMLIGLALYFFTSTKKEMLSEYDTTTTLFDGTYSINGENITLVRGRAEKATAPGSASKTTTQYFGNEVRGDFDTDGREDVAFLLTQETGGSGTFFYLVALLDTENGTRGTEAFFIGDRIAPQTTEARADGSIAVHFADRNFGEGFDTAPSVGKSLFVKLDPTTLQFREVVQSLPEGVKTPLTESTARTIAENTCIKGGEALSAGYYNESSKTWWFDANLNTTREGCNPACVVSEETGLAEINWRCTGLTPPDTNATFEMKTWTWTDDHRGLFTLTFSEDGHVSIGTDCNSMGGSYTAEGTSLTFSELMSTLMYCEGSREQEFSALLDTVTGYRFGDNDELILSSQASPELMIFE